MGNDADNLALAQEADRLGYAVVWAAEAYGSDAVDRAGLDRRADRADRHRHRGAADPGRTPAMTAMTAATLDALSGGRFRLGLGVSGPQVSEGWHGVRFAEPLARTREYVDIVKLALLAQAGALRRRALTAAAAGRARQVAGADRCTRSASTSRSTSPRSGRRTWS